MQTIHLDDFLINGIIKEKQFREKVKNIDWSQYENKIVMIKGCTSAPVPTWTYLIITAELTNFAKQILYGESCSAVKIYKKQ